jgi:hypothetical protein
MDRNLSTGKDSYRKGCGFPHLAARARAVSNSPLRQLQMAEGLVAHIVQLLPPIMSYARVISQEQRAICPITQRIQGIYPPHQAASFSGAADDGIALDVVWPSNGGTSD